MTEEEKTACGYLPNRLAGAVRNTCARYGQPIAEIRLRANGPLTLTLGGRKEAGKNVLCGPTCTKEELEQTTEKLCGGSLYSHFESICRGMILTAEGFRCGVAGRAVVQGGRLVCVRDISSVNIRVPHRVPGAADGLCELLLGRGERESRGPIRSALLISPPGKGKTTVLRELIPCLAEGKGAVRVAVMDTRLELGAGMPPGGLADYYSGWPRAEGVLAAIRTMSPQVVLCDEIAEESEAEAIRRARASGVAVVASAHGSSEEDLKKNPAVAALWKEGVFDLLCGIGEGGVEVLARYD